MYTHVSAGTLSHALIHAVLICKYLHSVVSCFGFRTQFHILVRKTAEWLSIRRAATTAAVDVRIRKQQRHQYVALY